MNVTFLPLYRLIIEWTNKKHNGELPRYGVCSSKKMEETKFEDLTIKLGYVFVHQGNCEHLLIFRDLRYMFQAKISWQSLRYIYFFYIFIIYLYYILQHMLIL